jgi:hypothetical protein
MKNSLLYMQAKSALIYGYSFKGWLEICDNAKENENLALIAYNQAKKELENL